MFSGLDGVRRRSSTQTGIVYVRVLLNGGLQSLADTLLQPVLLLAALVWLLGGSTMDIAMLAVAAALPWAVSSVIMPLVLTYAEAVSAVTIVSGGVRGLAGALIAFLGWRATNLEGSTLITLLVLGFFAYQVGSAVNAQASHALYSVTPRTHQATVRAFDDRRLAGAAMATLGGLVAWRALDTDAALFPRAAGWLLLLAGTAVVAATWFQLTLPGLTSVQRSLPRPFVEGGIHDALRQRPLQRFLAYRLLLGASTLADPFIVVYGLSEMSLAPRYIGASILAFTLAQIFGDVLWKAMVASRSSRRPLQTAALLRLAAIPLALVLPGVVSSATYQEQFDSPAVASWAFVAVFVLLGLARTAHDEAEQQYLADLTPDPPRQRAAIMTTNLLLIVTAGAALAGAVLIERFSLETALITAAVIAFVALIASSLLVEGNPRVQYRTGLWPERPRRKARIRRPARARRRKP